MFYLNVLIERAFRPMNVKMFDTHIVFDMIYQDIRNACLFSLQFF